MLTFYIINSLVVLLRVYFILSKKLRWISIIRKKPRRYPHMLMSLFLLIPVQRILLRRVITFDTLVCQFTRKASCLEITNMLLTVPSTRIPSYISVTLHYNFIESGRLLNIRWFPSTMYMGDKTQLIYYQSIGDTIMFGDFSSHFYYRWRIIQTCLIWS